MKELCVIKNESGSILVIALIMLVLLTILGISATTTSNIEMQIAGNERNYKRAFYVANAGIEHVRASLAKALTDNNANDIATTGGANLNWTSALTGATGNDWDGGVTWIDNQPFAPINGYTYTVKIWNDETGSATVDGNKIIAAECDASGPSGSGIKVKILVYLKAAASGEAINAYSAQQGGGSPKNYSSDDLNAIGTFTSQI